MISNINLYGGYFLQLLRPTHLEVPKVVAPPGLGVRIILQDGLHLGAEAEPGAGRLEGGEADYLHPPQGSLVRVQPGVEEVACCNTCQFWYLCYYRPPVPLLSPGVCMGRVGTSMGVKAPSCILLVSRGP